MILSGKFVYISGEKRESNGNVYCDVNVECVTNEEVVRMSCVPELLPNLKKYSRYEMAVDIRDGVTKDGVKYIVKKVVDAKPL